jgi:predicted transcriptional regulator
VLAEAVALLDSVIDIAGPDVAEDRRRLDDFNRTGLAVPLDDVKAWVESWGSPNELPRPMPRKLR